MAFYGVMAFTGHATCKQDTLDASNPTEILVLNFIVGFILHLVNFILATFVEPSLRASYWEIFKKQGETAEVRRILITIETIEYIFRFLFLLFSAYQIVSLGDPGVVYCTQEVKALNAEV